jgi:hypothetical protein
MTIDLNGCRAKIARTDMHLTFLHERVESFVDDGGAYQLETQPDSKTGEIAIYGEAFGEPHAHEWGAIIGDVVHDLRSALDHLVWQLTLDNGHTPPAVIPWNRSDLDFKWRRIGFPIYTFVDPRKQSPSGRRIPWRYKPPDSLWGVRPALRTELQRLQPFNHGQDAPKKPLAILDELWNIDKHRHLHLALFFVGLHDVESRDPRIQFRIVKKKSPGPFKGRAEIGRVEPVGGPYRNLVMVQKNVQPILTFDIAFEQGPPAYGGRVMETLERLHDTVAAILVKFESEFT